MSEIPFSAFRAKMNQKNNAVDMSTVVGKKDILFLCFDTLRYDAAIEEEKNGGTPNLNQYGEWEKRQAPGNFTYPSHHAIFSGFLPLQDEARNLAEAQVLFIPKGMMKKAPDSIYEFSGGNIPTGLRKAGYDTWCVGGVTFFDKRSDIGNVFPSMFEKSWWNPSFSCPVKDSAKNQVDHIIKKLDQKEDDRHIFMYLNFSAIHYPNSHYIEGAKSDSLETHKAALRYVDGEFKRLMDAWKEKRGDAFVICFSDHGTCYGEDGFTFHSVNHPVVSTVPYKHFFLINDR